MKSGNDKQGITTPMSVEH